MKYPGLVLLLICSLATLAQQKKSRILLTERIPNPVLTGVADAGVIRYNGEYYIGGVNTKGSFYQSSDLVNWSGPKHVFSMNNQWATGNASGDQQIHANDMVYINGMFHMYWSVNYWGNDKNVIHIGHAASPNILGPYKEPDTTNWLDNRIDPKLFVDENGKLYMYMVKFTDGNTIWVRPMSDPSTFSGEPVYQFASLPNTWETADNKVAEGPWVIKYRDQYYMMYNANHTSTQWGNYMLGVAQADHPMQFNHGNKYSYPVLKSNQFDLQDRFADLLQYDTADNGSFWYNTELPETKDWPGKINTGKHGGPGTGKSTAGGQIKVDASTGWKAGKPGFGSELTKGSTSRNKRTDWNTPLIHILRNFNYKAAQHGKLALRLNHSGPTQVYLNGGLIYDSSGSKYLILNLDQRAMKFVKEGVNIIAVRSQAGRRAFLDVSLFAMQDASADELVYSPGQPNILKGPNGFEWWLIYMADKANHRRSQFIDRVHFFDRQLIVAGSNGIESESRFPPPAKASFSDLFDSAVFNKDAYQVISGSLINSEGAAVQIGGVPLKIILSTKPADNYHFEVGIKPGSAKTGIYAWYQDEQNNISVLLDSIEKKLVVHTRLKNQVTTKSALIPADFNFRVYHTVSIYLNSGLLSLQIDGLRITGFDRPLKLAVGKGVPGLFSDAGESGFDGLIFTRGFDEYDENFSGWGPSVMTGNKSVDSSGDWVAGKYGLRSQDKTSEARIFKGDPLENYEFGTQVSLRDTGSKAGIFAAYIDDNNYLKYIINRSSGKAVFEWKEKGKLHPLPSVPVQYERSFYTDMKHSDFFERVYRFGGEPVIAGLRLSRTAADGSEKFFDSLYRRMNIEFDSAGHWRPLKNISLQKSNHPGFDSLGFDPVRARGLRFTNREPGDRSRYVYKIWVTEETADSYNLRVRKTNGRIELFLNERSILVTETGLKASQVGLVTQATVATFNGALLYELPH